MNTANTVAAMHLSDSLTRLKFVDEIRQVVMQQFEAARRARNDEDCIRGPLGKRKISYAKPVFCTD